jgi:PAS domain S-box-containing protein
MVNGGRMAKSANSFEAKFAGLRRRAEAQLPQQPGELANLSPEQIDRLVHELRVHQLELEMQNEQLRQTQLELEVARDQYADLYEFAPVGYITLNEQGVILAANLTAATLLGVERASLIRQPLGHFIVKEDQDAVYLFRRRLFETRLAQVGEARLLKHDGAHFYTRLEAIVQGEGESSVCRIAVSDITEHKLVEQYMLRTERLAAMGQLATMLADEIKNPLYALRLSMDIVLNHIGDANQRETHLELCSQEIDRLIEATNHTLDFARPERIAQEPIRVNHLVMDILTLVGKLVSEAHIQVTTDLPQDLPPIPVAPDQFVQIFVNLIINAIEAMPDGGWIHITAEAEQDSIRLMLANQGPAISPERFKHIFDPAFTAEPRGTGLGLSISRSIIRKSGGDLTVENLRSGAGVAFILRLPIHA